MGDKPPSRAQGGEKPLAYDKAKAPPAQDKTKASVQDQTKAPVQDQTKAPVQDKTKAPPAQDKTKAPVTLQDKTKAPAQDKTKAPVQDQTKAPVQDRSSKALAQDKVRPQSHDKNVEAQQDKAKARGDKAETKALKDRVSPRIQDKTSAQAKNKARGQEENKNSPSCLFEFGNGDYSSTQEPTWRVLTLNMRGERIYMPEEVLVTEYPKLYVKLFGINAVPHTKCANGEQYYDADATVFRLLLSYYKYGKMHLPAYICGPLLEKEVEFWGVNATPDCLEACCMHSALESKRWKVLLDEFERKALTPPADDSMMALTDDFRNHLFVRLWNVINRPCSSVLASVYALLIFICSIASAVLYTKDPPNSCSDWTYKGTAAADVNCTLPDGSLSGLARADSSHVAAQCAFAVFFSVDLVLRALLAPNRAKFLRSLHTWNDLVSLVPLYGFLLYRMSGSQMVLGSSTGWLFELLSVTLFFRVFRIIRHFIGVRVMAYTLMTGLNDMLIVMLLVFTATFLFGTIFFLVERSHSDKVTSMFHGYYWAVITITTVGYGDVTPSTLEGRILAILCGLVGLIVVAFTVPILTENFHRYYGHTCHLSLRGELAVFVL